VTVVSVLSVTGLPGGFPSNFYPLSFPTKGSFNFELTSLPFFAPNCPKIVATRWRPVCGTRTGPSAEMSSSWSMSANMSLTDSPSPTIECTLCHAAHAAVLPQAPALGGHLRPCKDARGYPALPAPRNVVAVCVRVCVCVCRCWRRRRGGGGGARRFPSGRTGRCANSRSRVAATGSACNTQHATHNAQRATRNEMRRAMQFRRPRAAGLCAARRRRRCRTSLPTVDPRRSARAPARTQATPSSTVEYRRVRLTCAGLMYSTAWQYLEVQRRRSYATS
jgi:hypothetical protein